MKHLSSEAGSTNPLLIASILLALLSAGLGGFSVWAFANYQDQKNNTDAKIETAVTDAKEAQAETLEKQFIEREKQPYTKFNGPDDLGHVSFDYPKTWSVYIAKDGSGTSDYEAYMHPVNVPTVSTQQPYATRVVISGRDYETTLRSYESLVKKGDLKRSPVTINGFTGIRLDGTFTKQRQGSSVIFKVRDKTLTISSDATAFRNDFDTVVLKSLDFNP